MRSFTESAGANVPDPEYEPTNWLQASDLKGVPFIITQANLTQGDYGDRFICGVLLPGEGLKPAPTYSLGFGERSKAFAQLKAIKQADTKGGDKQFPLSVTVKQWGKRSFELADAPEMTEDMQVASRFLGSRSRRAAAEAKAEANRVEPSNL